MSAKPNEKRYGKFQKFVKPADVPSTSYSESEIKEKLENYREDNILNIPQHTHVRYFSAVRDYKTKAIVLQNGKPKITFKPGGFLKSKHVTINPDGTITGYVILSNKPHTDHSEVAKTFSVQVEPTTKFYKIRSKYELEEEERVKKEAELAKMREEVEKAKKDKEATKEIKKQSKEKDEEIERLKKELKELKKGGKKL